MITLGRTITEELKKKYMPTKQKIPLLLCALMLYLYVLWMLVLGLNVWILAIAGLTAVILSVVLVRLAKTLRDK
jgi:Flp pilus assembly protein TadB